MRKRIIAVMAVVLIAATGSAVAAAPSPKLAKKYLHIYAKVVKVQGNRAPGRNIIRWGFAPGKPATAAQVRKSIEILRRMVTPHLSALSALPAQSPSYKPTQVQRSAAAASGAGGGGGGSFAACIREHESSGNYQSHDGAYGGAYQFDRQTWAAAGGSGDPAAASPAEQDARFQSWYAQHPEAWPTRRFCGG